VARGVLEEGNSFGQRRKVVRGVPSIVGKIDEWLVATTMVKAWQKKWPKWWLRGGKEKLGRKMVFFFSQLWLMICPSLRNGIHLYL
jgi:hypothetical protein